MEDHSLKVFIVTRKYNSSYFAKGEVLVAEVKIDKEKVILKSNMGV